MNETALQLHRRHRLELAVAHLTGGNVTALGRLLGYRDGAFVRQMLSGNRAVSDKTVRAIEALRGMEGWFSHQAAAAPPSLGIAEPAAYYELTSGDEEAVVAVPTATVSLRAGVPGYTVEKKEVPAALPRALFAADWVRQRGYSAVTLLGLKMLDDSMEPSLHEADLLTVDTRQLEPVDGLVFAVNYEGVCLIRRVVRDHGAWWLVADNHLRFPRKQLVAPDALLIGRVVHVDSEVT
jgi:hypothetical protein